VQSFVLHVSALFLVLVGLGIPSSADAARNHDKALKDAASVIRSIGDQVPSDTRDNASCVSVITIAKGGFIFGGTGGHGFLTCKRRGGAWTAPVVLKVGGGSVGFQIGGAKVELIMVFTNVGDVEQVARTVPLFSAKVSATAGDKGAGISGGIGVEGGGEVVTVSRSEGLYAGAVGEAMVIDPDTRETAELLGGTHTLRDILVKGLVPVPSKAKDFVEAVRHWYER
jgi:lipid-binding SYLF domain-containing protein